MYTLQALPKLLQKNFFYLFCFSYYTKFEGHEIMYHVSTLLPFSTDDIQQVSCIIYPVSCILYPLSCILYPVCCILYPVSCILLFVPFVLYPVSYITHIYPVPCILYIHYPYKCFYTMMSDDVYYFLFLVNLFCKS